jgi:hypothetical protein
MHPATQKTITVGAPVDRAQVTVLSNQEPGIVWFAGQCQTNQVRLEALIRNAERVRDPEMAALFRCAAAVGEALAKRDALASRRPTQCTLAWRGPR